MCPLYNRRDLLPSLPTFSTNWILLVYQRISSENFLRDFTMSEILSSSSFLLYQLAYSFPKNPGIIDFISSLWLEENLLTALFVVKEDPCPKLRESLYLFAMFWILSGILRIFGRGWVLIIFLWILFLWLKWVLVSLNTLLSKLFVHKTKNLTNVTYQK